MFPKAPSNFGNGLVPKGPGGFAGQSKNGNEGVKGNFGNQGSFGDVKQNQAGFGGQGAKGFQDNSAGWEGAKQGKAPGQYLSGMAQSQLLGMGMSMQGVRQLASGIMPTAPGDQQVVVQVVTGALG